MTFAPWIFNPDAALSKRFTIKMFLDWVKNIGEESRLPQRPDREIIGRKEYERRLKES